MAPLRQEDYFYESFTAKPIETPKETLPVKTEIPKPKTKGKVFFGVLAFIIALTIVYRFAMINNMNMNNIKLKKELADINNVNSQLQLAAEKSINLTEIEKYASENLGLQKPQNYQIEYIKIDKEDLIDNKITYENKNWFEKIVFNVIDFFN